MVWNWWTLPYSLRWSTCTCRAIFFDRSIVSQFGTACFRSPALDMVHVPFHVWTDLTPLGYFRFHANDGWPGNSMIVYKLVRGIGVTLWGVLLCTSKVICSTFLLQIVSNFTVNVCARYQNPMVCGQAAYWFPILGIYSNGYAITFYYHAQVPAQKC